MISDTHDENQPKKKKKKRRRGRSKNLKLDS